MNTELFDVIGIGQSFLLSIIMNMGNQLLNTQNFVP